MVKLIKNVYESTMMGKDDDFIIEFLRDKYNKNYSEVLEIFQNKEYELTEDEIGQIEEQKDIYYT
jgi:hypothetical protein